MVRCEDGTAVEFHTLGDVHLDDTEVGLDEGIIDGHLRRQFLETTSQHRIELLVDGTEIAPLGADVHLLLAAARCGGFDRGFADNGTHFGLAINVLANLAPDLCVYSENFCHCFTFLMLDFLFTRLCGLAYMCTCGVASKDGAKVQGCQKPDSGIVGLRGDKG